MFRSLIAAAGIFVLTFSALIIPRQAMACPEELPETLLSLYKNSSEIHIATFDKSEDVSISEDTADYRVVDIKKHFTISSTLKGETRKFFVLEEQEYRYKNQDPESGNAGAYEAEEYGRVDLKGGETLLLFLKTDEESGKLGMTHYRDAIKPMPAEHIGSYETRIRELNGIFNNGKASDAAIVNWLMGAIEDPATRWEGAFELEQSFSQMGWRDEAAKNLAEQKANGEAVEEPEAANVEGEEAEHGEEMADTSAYARLLTDDQKQQLADILLAEAKKGDEKEEEKADELIKKGNDALVTLVQNWRDPRFPEFFLEQLRASTADSWVKYDLMNAIANQLDDEDLKKIATGYSDISYQEDDAVVEAQTPLTAGLAETTGNDATPGESIEKSAAAAENNLDTVAAEAKVTYKELRRQREGEFISRADAVVAERNANAVEIVAR